jgi:1-acyl-sn-glycerol-3-phosphate acyltransferase
VSDDLCVSLYAVGITVVDAVLGMATRRTHLHTERIPSTGPAVVVSNHVSISDPLVLGCALRRAGRRGTFLAMVEAFSWPVVGWLLRRTGQIPVRRGVDPIAAMRPAIEALAAGWVVALYPEGRITNQPDYRPMPTGRTGAVRLALQADCPIVPVAQWGAHRLVTRERTSSLTRRLRFLGRLRPNRVPRRPTVTVIVGEPVSVTELRAAAGPDGDLRAATDLVMARVRALLGEIAGKDLPDLLA